MILLFKVIAVLISSMVKRCSCEMFYRLWISFMFSYLHSGTDKFLMILRAGLGGYSPFYEYQPLI